MMSMKMPRKQNLDLAWVLVEVSLLMLNQSYVVGSWQYHFHFNSI
jgi:hypothetical protein